MRFPIRGVIEKGHWGIARIVLDVVGRMVEAHVVETAGAAQGAAIQIVFPPFQTCSIVTLISTY